MKTIPAESIRKPFDMFHPGNLDHASFQSELEAECFNGLIYTVPAVKYYISPRILEVGTYRGCSIAQIHRMAPFADLHTLNILPEQATGNVIELLPMNEIGKYARDNNVNFTQHYGDSKTFDFMQFDHLDVIFIDGNHSPEYVESDSRRLLPALTTDGIMIWHDYHIHNSIGVGVVETLNRLNDTLFNGELVHVDQTSLVYYRKNK